MHAACAFAELANWSLLYNFYMVRSISYEETIIHVELKPKF